MAEAQATGSVMSYRRASFEGRLTTAIGGGRDLTAARRSLLRETRQATSREAAFEPADAAANEAYPMSGAEETLAAQSQPRSTLDPPPLDLKSRTVSVGTATI